MCGTKLEVVRRRWVGELEMENLVGRGRGDRSRVENLGRGNKAPKSIG